MSKKMKKGFSRKAFLFTLAAVLLIGCSVGGTLAWLTANTDAVKNTFTVGNINITLTETKKDFKMVPGCTIAKDPKVTVETGSEACWLFVKIAESANLDDFITYTVVTGENGWTALTDADNDGIADDGVYYRQVPAPTAADTTFSVLKDDEVTVLDTVTKEMMNGLTITTYPTLTFTAYACQLYKSNGVEFTAAEAWAEVPKS